MYGSTHWSRQYCCYNKRSGQKAIIIRLIRVRSQPTQTWATSSETCIHSADHILSFFFIVIRKQEEMHKFSLTYKKKKPLRSLLTEYQMAFICKYTYKWTCNKRDDRNWSTFIWNKIIWTWQIKTQLFTWKNGSLIKIHLLWFDYLCVHSI